MAPKPDVDPELRAAMRDAQRGGTGWLRIIRITTGENGHARITRIPPARVLLLDEQKVTIDHLAPLILATACKSCDAQVDEPCTTPSGRRTTFHAARSRPIYDAWLLGQRDAHADALRRLTGEEPS